MAANIYRSYAPAWERNPVRSSVANSDAERPVRCVPTLEHGNDTLTNFLHQWRHHAY